MQILQKNMQQPKNILQIKFLRGVWQNLRGFFGKNAFNLIDLFSKMTKRTNASVFGKVC
jgi:hypothetical protein